MYLIIENNSFKVYGSKPIKIDFTQKPSNELFETIKIKDGSVKNLEYHQKRVDFAYENYFKSKPINLKEYLINLPKNGLYRAKLIYNEKGFLNLNYYSYTPKQIKKVIIAEAKIDYRFKYLKRDFFEYLQKNFEADEFIITQNGYLKDFSIGNIALLKNNTWHSPKEPLLQGTVLSRYAKKLKFIDINYKNLKSYSKIALLNAMVDFKIL